jgi:hypothetical protein
MKDLGVRLNLASHLPHHATTSPYYCCKEQQPKSKSTARKEGRGGEGGGKGSGVMVNRLFSNPLYNGVALSELAAAIAMRRPTTESKTQVGIGSSGCCCCRVVIVFIGSIAY